MIKTILTKMINITTDQQTIELLNNWPKGQKLIESNHISMMDGPLLSLIIPEPIIAPVAIEYCKGISNLGLKLLEQTTGGIVVPLDRASPTKGTIKLLKRAQNSQMSILIFPEGKINSNQNQTTPTELKSGAAWLKKQLQIKTVCHFNLAKSSSGYHITARLTNH
jgi:1-acyl-sn-glycerol-3-phosphate acyltransferase